MLPDELSTYTYFDEHEPIKLWDYLQTQGFTQGGEKIISLSKLGRSVFNNSLLVRTNQRSFVIKQARPFVDSGELVVAPDNRISVEAQFYQSIKGTMALQNATTEILALDEESKLIIFKYIPYTKNMSFIYSKPELMQLSHIGMLCFWLTNLHEIWVSGADKVVLQNREMVELNFHRTFVAPYQIDNLEALDAEIPGLSTLAIELKERQNCAVANQKLGRIFLNQRDALLHGNFYPTNWLLDRQKKIYVVNPGYCFFGPGEYDLGKLIAHLKLAGCSAQHIEVAKAEYKSQRKYDVDLVSAFAAAEMIRALLSPDFLPNQMPISKRKEWLEIAENMLSSVKLS